MGRPKLGSESSAHHYSPLSNRLRGTPKRRTCQWHPTRNSTPGLRKTLGEQKPSVSCRSVEDTLDRVAGPLPVSMCVLTPGGTGPHQEVLLMYGGVQLLPHSSSCREKRFGFNGSKRSTECRHHQGSVIQHHQCRRHHRGKKHSIGNRHRHQSHRHPPSDGKCRFGQSPPCREKEW